jgi:1L-myo-inositol 1-phosphate cytidylyltransferase
VQAIVLAAGAGTRLRDRAAVKPLAPLAGRPLIAHVAERLFAAGVDELIVVLGYRASLVDEALDQLRSTGRTITTVVNERWETSNGVSVLSAAPFVQAPALLTMADHLVEPALYARVAEVGARAGGMLTLGVDRRIGHPWIDPDDVTRVATQGDRITAIGKLLDPFDAYDTGVFMAGQELFDSLASLEQPSLSDGVRRLAAEGRALAADCSAFSWLDVDDGRAYSIARDWLEPPTARLATGR